MKQNALALVLSAAVVGLGVWAWFGTSESRRATAAGVQRDRENREWMAGIVEALREQSRAQGETNQAIRKQLESLDKQIARQSVPPEARKDLIDKKGGTGLTEDESKDLKKEIGKGREAVAADPDDPTRSQHEEGLQGAEDLVNDPLKALKNEKDREQFQQLIDSLKAEEERSRKEILRLQELQRETAREIARLRSKPKRDPEEEKKLREAEEKNRQLQLQIEKEKKKNDKTRLVLSIIKGALMAGALVAAAYGQPGLAAGLLALATSIPVDGGGGPGGSGGTGEGGAKVPEPPPPSSGTGESGEESGEKPPSSEGGEGGGGNKPPTGGSTGKETKPQSEPIGTPSVAGSAGSDPPSQGTRRSTGTGGKPGSGAPPSRGGGDVVGVGGDQELQIKGLEIHRRKKDEDDADWKFFMKVNEEVLKKLKAGVAILISEPGDVRRLYLQSPRDKKTFWMVEVGEKGRGDVKLQEIPEDEISGS